MNTVANTITDAITSFNPISMFHKRLQVVKEEEDTYASFSNKAHGCFPRLAGMDPSKVLIHLTEEDLARAAQINRAFRDATRTYEAIRYAKLESRPYLDLAGWYRLGLASRGNAQTWAKLRRRLGREPVRLCAVENYSDLDPERFEREYEMPSVPVVIKGASLGWLGASEWTVDSLEHRYGDVMFRFNDLHGEEVTLTDFVRYARTTDDDFPLGLYDSQMGVDDNDPRRVMLSEYVVPECFGKDVFELAKHSAHRPPYRWLLVGLPRGGTEMHVDPLGTSAWVTLVQGRKRWALFPPDYNDKALGGVNSTEAQSSRVPSAVEWFLQYWGTPATADAVEILQQPGDTVFVPGGWKHIVINLDETVAITHNYAPRCNLNAIMEQCKEAEPEFSADLERALKE